VPTPVVAPAPLQFDWSGDLTQIETNRAKLQAAQTLATSSSEPSRVRRVRPVLPPVSDEPLMQVETQSGETLAQTAPS